MLVRRGAAADRTSLDPEVQAGTSCRAVGWQEVGFSRADVKYYADNYPVAFHPKKLWLNPPAVGQN